jgi:DNA invertase Pin-like site-specific DNA recombinase
MNTITIGLLVRNSTARQVGNYRSEAQYDMGPRVEGRGYAVRYYDEQGVSGKDLSKRKITMSMLEDLKAGVIQGIGSYDFKRLTRDEFGIDGGTIARIVVQAGGRFHTSDREYNLRLDDDLLQFQFQCFIAGIDWRNIRNTFWSGIFKKLEQEPHYMKTPVGYMNVADDREKRHVAKNPEHQDVIDALARAFDECDSLAEVARRLNTEGPARPASRGRGGDSTRWHVYGIRYILRNSIYTGTYSFGDKLKERSTVWDRFAMDETGQPKTFLQHVPKLAYWDAARVRRWRRKFDKPAMARMMKSGRRQALAGVLECSSCGSRMIGHGPGNYACSAVGSGKGRGAIVCTAPQILTEKVTMQVLRQELPRALSDAQDLAERARRGLLERKPSAATQRLAFLAERSQTVRDAMFQPGAEAAIPVLTTDLGRVEAEMAVLKVQIADEKDAELNDEQLTASLDMLLTSPLEAFDALPLEMQGRVYRMLFANVRIETQGFAAGRQWRLQSYTAALVGEPRVTIDAPWGRKPNPKVKMQGERVLQFENSERTVASDISARAYVDYLGSLRSLAEALVGAA